MTSTKENTKSAKKPRRMAREPKPAAAEGSGAVSSDDPNSAPPVVPPAQAMQPASADKPVKPPSKASLVLEMLQQPAGATIEQMVAATGWLPHTTRAVLTGFKKKGHVVTSDKADGVRTYRIAEASTEPTPAPAGSQTTADA